MIVGVCGSPRKGASEYVLSQALSMLEESGLKTQLFTIRGKRINFCTHCDFCLKNGECVIRDDMDTVYELFKEAEGYVFATPVYNGGVSGQLKTVMDRCRALLAANRNVFRGKAGMAIAIGGDRAGGQELAIQQIVTFYILNGALPVSGGFFGANLGATFWSRDSLESVKKDDEGFRSLEKTVKRFTEVLEKPKAEGKHVR